MNESGWFPAVDSRRRDEDGRPVGEPNVEGRFDDHQIIDGAASKARGGRKNVYRIGIKLHSRVLVSPVGTASNDVSGQTIKFSDYPDEAETALRRFPQAWKDYQKRRKAPLQNGEREVLEIIGIADTVKKRGPRPKPNGKVVPLKPDAA